MPAFTDSVDDGSYPTGVCGEKTLTLDAGTPAFLILTQGVDPVLDPFTIDYDQALATEADIGVHTIAYRVTMKEYSGTTTVTELSGTFIFEISSSST